MKASIIKVGNSHGIRIPKPILEQCGFEKEVELEVKNQQLIIKTTKRPRKNWGGCFCKMAANKDDQLIETVNLDW